MSDHAMINRSAHASPEREGRASRQRSVGLLAVRVLNYLTNHVVSHVPSFALRRMWYQHVLGIHFGEHAGVHLGCYIWFYGPGQIRRAGVRIGRNARINRSCTLDVREGLVIGDNASLSAEVFVLGAAGRIDGGRSREESRPVVIEDNAWIGVRAVIMPGVRVGRGAVVGAGAVVTRDVPPMAVVFGNPARAVGNRSDADLEYSIDGPLPLFE